MNLLHNKIDKIIPLIKKVDQFYNNLHLFSEVLTQHPFIPKSISELWLSKTQDMFTLRCCPKNITGVPKPIK